MMLLIFIVSFVLFALWHSIFRVTYFSLKGMVGTWMGCYLASAVIVSFGLGLIMQFWKIGALITMAVVGISLYKRLSAN